MDIAAGEYGYTVFYFRRMLAAGAVDVLQADATRCAGITGFLQAGALCHAFELPFSFHCAPALHAAAACAVPGFWAGEYFFDHARIEQMLFDGAPRPVNGALTPDRSCPGLGLDFKRADAERYRIDL
jgi:L-alanine-DL-glutamate epimerase-like enolase superfamily enzyme